MSLVEARILVGDAVPAAVVSAWEPDRDRETIFQLAEQCLRFSPLVSVDDVENPDAIFLDITGCEHLFGDERNLAMAAVAFLQQTGYTVRAGSAETLGAAWAAARVAESPEQPCLVPSGSVAEFLPALPIAVLRLRSAIIEKLADFGVQTIEQLQRLPRRSLPSRFGPQILQRLDQAFGRIEETLQPLQSTQPLRVRHDFEYPLEDRRLLEQVLTELAEALVNQLPCQRGVRSVCWTVASVEAPPVRVDVGFAQPTNCDKRITKLTVLRWERLALPERVTSLSGEATVTELIRTRQTDLFGDDQTEQHAAVTDLIERLSGRLGEQRVLRPQLTGDPLPEDAVQYHPAMSSRSKQPQDFAQRTWLTPITRPTILLPVPEQLQVWSLQPHGSPTRLQHRGRLSCVQQSWGPERMETGWWNDREIRRDYWTIATDHNERLWLFQDLTANEWFLHGLFD